MKQKENEMKVHGEDGYHKSCRNCGQFFWAERKNKLYCDASCRQKKYLKRKARKELANRLLAKFGLGTVKKSAPSKPKSKRGKLDYVRLTFLLSFIGFMGSIGFYLGVLRQIYSPASDKQKIEQLKEENEQLQHTIYQLIEQKEEDAGA